jgi:cytochrome c oxidase subunit 4
MNNIYSRRLLWTIWAVLLLLLVVTVGASYFHFGRVNTLVALCIAMVKAALIALYFMRLRTSSKLIWVVAVGSLVWLAILFTLTISDYATRRYLPKATVWAE